MKTQTISTCLWFDDQAEKAADFYVSIFENAKIINTTPYQVETPSDKPIGSVMTVDFELEGQQFTGLNGGPHFTPNSAISFFVMCETEDEVDRIWEELLNGGTALMKLDSYGWSEKYGWVQDRYGLTWQISLGKLDDVHGQKITPSLMYVSQRGVAEEAINHYTSIFKESDITGILRYDAGEEQPEGIVQHAQFRLNDGVFMAMDSSPEHAEATFNEAISFMVNCQTQEEVDYYWEKLSAVPEAEQCGWLKDKFGVSWQIVPAEMDELFSGEDTEKSKRAMEAMLRMKKLDIKKLKQAYEQG